MDQVSERRAFTEARITAFREHLKKADMLTRDKACVYATGSYGRCEASRHSDLDVFIVGLRKGDPEKPEERESRLSRLDELRVKAELIESNERLGIPKFDGDGKYLVHHSVDALTRMLGRPEDDTTNTFTARLLLLLESSPLIGHEVYDAIIDEVISVYWRDYADHKANFIPAYLANDILRLWRTFCVNYEARTSSTPLDNKIKRKTKNYKLKHSRVLTCYSAILYLLAAYQKEGTVSPTTVVEMTRLTPTRRLEQLLEQDDASSAHPSIRKLLEKYDEFLERSNLSEADLIEKFKDDRVSRDHFEQASDFGRTMFEAINRLGNGSDLHRMIIV